MLPQRLFHRPPRVAAAEARCAFQQHPQSFTDPAIVFNQHNQYRVGVQQSIIRRILARRAPKMRGNQNGAMTVMTVPSPGEARSSAEPPSHLARRHMFARPLPCWYAALSNPWPLSLTRSFK